MMVGICSRCNGQMMDGREEPYCVTCGHRPVWSAMPSTNGSQLSSIQVASPDVAGPSDEGRHNTTPVPVQPVPVQSVELVLLSWGGRYGFRRQTCRQCGVALHAAEDSICRVCSRRNGRVPAKPQLRLRVSYVLAERAVCGRGNLRAVPIRVASYGGALFWSSRLTNLLRSAFRDQVGMPLYQLSRFVAENPRIESVEDGA